MIDKSKNMMIGLFVIAAFAVVVFILMFLHPSVGDEALRLHVRFADVDKVTIGTRVTYGGKAVGEVTEINEIKDATDQRKPIDGEIYLYELVLQVDSNVHVFNSDTIALHTSGLLGERSVAIVPQPPKPGIPLKLVNDQILYASEVASVEETFRELKDVANKFDGALDEITDFFKTVKEEKIVSKVSDVIGNIAEFTNSLKDDNGTIPRLFKDDDLYLRLVSLLNKGETLMNDMNHYGLLFHLDKGWQRLRARRVNLLQKLSTPQEFRNYFNDEIDQITTSLSRVGMILEETENNCVSECLLGNEQFSKVFAELLRRVGALEDDIKMFNDQLNDCEVEKTEINVIPYYQVNCQD